MDNCPHCEALKEQIGWHEEAWRIYEHGASEYSSFKEWQAAIREARGKANELRLRSATADKAREASQAT